MFSVNHCIWMFICLVIVVISVLLLKKYRPPLKSVLTWAVIVSMISEAIKIGSVAKMIPVSSSDSVIPYITVNHMPLHICSLMIFLILYARFASDKKKVDSVLTFMYPTCILGGLGAIVFPSIFSTTISASQAFIHPVAYQTFLYHVMLMVLGIYIKLCGEVPMSRRSFTGSLTAYYMLMLLSVYVNSLLAVPAYENGTVSHLEFAPNFLFTVKSAVPFVNLNSKTGWLIYMLVYALCGVVSFALLFCRELCATSSKKEQRS
ncbi:MAG: YwaF family protein [Clostridiales bacterium]|nr:YwaF family protein [Clostridiales bacterium]